MSGHEHERLSAYLDGELAPAERAAVSAHLDSCTECEGRLAELRAADQAVAGVPAEPPPGYFEAFPARVRARLEPRAARRSLPAWTWAAAAALLLAVVTPLSLLRRPALAPSELPRQATAAPAAAAPAAADEAAPPLASAAPAVAARRDELAKLAQAPAARRPAAPSKREAAFAAPPGEADARALEAESARAERGVVTSPVAVPPAAAAAEAEVATLADTAGAPAAAPRNQATAFEERKARDRSRDAAAARQEPATAEEVAPHPASGRVAAAPAGTAVTGVGLRAPEAEWQRLDAARPRTAAEWRRLREQCRLFVAREPSGPYADAARVRGIEAALAAWRASQDPADAAAFEGDAAAYLAREDAARREHVRALLDAAAGRP